MNDKHPRCPECDSRDISITPVPGLWVQYWCNDCDHFWWERSDVASPTPSGATAEAADATPSGATAEAADATPPETTSG